jgi:predicted N-acyltransferase
MQSSTACGDRPIVVRRDVPLERIDAGDWNRLAGGQPFLSHAFLAALHATGARAGRPDGRRVT